MFAAQDQGWGDYYDSRVGMGDLVALATMSGLTYTPDTSPVEVNGDKSTYYPRDTTQDAQALNYLGFLSDAALQNHVGTTGSQAGDMQGQAGAWDPAFQAAVNAFQGSAGISRDGWIGPATRQALGNAVAAQNGRTSPIQPPNVIPPAVVPIGPTPNLPPTPNPQPQPGGGGAASSGWPWYYYVGAAVGVGVLGYAAYELL